MIDRSIDRICLSIYLSNCPVSVIIKGLVSVYSISLIFMKGSSNSGDDAKGMIKSCILFKNYNKTRQQRSTRSRSG